MNNALGIASLFHNQLTSDGLWGYADERFRQLDRQLYLKPQTLTDVETKISRIARCLNLRYYGHSGMTNCALGGSLVKGTAIHPLNDVDLFFFLPPEVYWRYNAYSTGGQSAMLQEVKHALSGTYSKSGLRGDGQVVVLDTSSVQVEIIPAFHAIDGRVLIADTNNGGRWKAINPKSELEIIDQFDRQMYGRFRPLVRMLKQWKRECDVPIKSFHLERVAAASLAESKYPEWDWFDWHFRDAIHILLNSVYGGFQMPGNPGEWISLGADWYSKAISANTRVLKACEFERWNRDFLAGAEWRKIFGNKIPETMT